jgi:hypothetical protein
MQIIVYIEEQRTISITINVISNCSIKLIVYHIFYTHKYINNTTCINKSYKKRSSDIEKIGYQLSFSTERTTLPIHITHYYSPQWGYL